MIIQLYYSINALFRHLTLCTLLIYDIRFDFM